VLIKDASGNVLKRYSYDGLHRRIQETANDTTTDLYYSDQWQVLEERVGGQTTVQYVWSPVYVDALVPRDRDTNGDGTLDERIWVVQDANYNVVALLDNSGNVVERYGYDPFGQVTVLNADFTPKSTGNNGTPADSTFGWLCLHQGGRFDDVSGLYHFRRRDYSPTLGRWVSLDPLGYDAGDVNLFRYVANNPVIRTDPWGLWYLDFSFAIPIFPILTINFGVQIGQGPPGLIPFLPWVHFYGGFGRGSSGLSVTFAPFNNISPGLNVGLSGFLPKVFVGGQVGVGGWPGVPFPGAPFLEVGVGTPGVNFAVVWVF
jgi:RHS repeat-associated protein